jgi:hypothetical protein
MSRRHFNMLRAAFWLLAVVVMTELTVTLVAIGSCVWVIVINGRQQFGACENIGAQMREIWSEVLAAILALLLAARGPSPPSPPDRNGADNAAPPPSG